LIERVEAIGALSSRITVSSVDGRAVFDKYVHDPSTFTYVDPPYVDMGGSLYLNAFTHRDHADLALSVGGAAEANWVLTYDTSDFIRRLYRNHQIRQYQLSYSARRTGKAHELLIASRPVARLLADC
jgi:DNA adenine methylase